MVLFGGGHNNYFGSDVHAFDLATREWSRISDGYVTGSADEYGADREYPESTYPDGSPLPPHTYDYVQYDPVGNDFILFKGALALGPNPKAVAIPHLFNLDSGSWRHGPRHDEAILNSGGWTTWDPARRTIWGHSGDDGGGNAFIGFAVDGENQDGTFGRWGTLYPNKLPGIANHNAMQIDPTGAIIIIAVHRKNGLFWLSPNTPEAALVPLREDRGQPSLSAHAALEYAPNLDRFIYFSATDRGRIYAVGPDEALAWPESTDRLWRWTCLSEPDLTRDPIADAAELTAYDSNVHHTFGRFRVASFGTTDLAILVRHVDTPVYVMRLGKRSG